MCLRQIVDMYGDIDLRACIWCQERSVRCSIAQQGCAGKGSGEKRQRGEKGHEMAERTWDKDDSSDEELPSKRAKVAEVIAEDTPPPIPESVEGEKRQLDEVDDRVEGEAEKPWVAEGLGQGAREARPDKAPLVLALRELTKVCQQGF